MKKALILSLFVLLICLTENASAQQFLFFRFTDGTQGIYPLQQVKHMDFANNQARLRLNDGTEYAWPITSVDHYKYTDIITSADEASPAADPWQVQVFPNPSDGKQYLRFRLPAAGNAEVKVHDLAGKLIFRQSLDKLSAGQQEISLNWPAVRPGSYRMQLKSKQFSVSKPIIRN
jgi:hypothetical protein